MKCITEKVLTSETFNLCLVTVSQFYFCVDSVIKCTWVIDSLVMMIGKVILGEGGIWDKLELSIVLLVMGIVTLE